MRFCPCCNVRFCQVFPPLIRAELVNQMHHLVNLLR